MQKHLAIAAAALLVAGLARTHPAAATDPVLVGAGDIASCSSSGDEATAALLDGIAGTVFTAGDNAYDSGSATEYSSCYDPSWGRHKARTFPSPGNHEYGTPGAAGYFGYFGAAAGEAGEGYYSYDLGAWHIIALNSYCSAVPCAAGSAQEQWLRADLSAHPGACTLAYWHHPLFSSGPHGSQPAVQPLWQALYDFGADVVISGHDHDYERFAPQSPAGAADPVAGIRQFVVGTGGRNLYTLGAPLANSEVGNDDTFGVLKLTLHPASYEWQFVPVAGGGTFTDSGSEACRPASGDSDGDGYNDSLESGTPLCGDGRNEDSPDDGIVDDGCPVGPAQAGTYSEAQFKIGTGPLDPCGTDGWPADLVSGGIPDSTNRVTIADLTSFLAPTRRLYTNPGHPAFSPRWDLAPGRSFFPSWIAINDLTALLTGPSGFPPMLGSARAFGGPPCPWAP